MNENDERNFANQADVLIHEILKAQPNLLANASMSADSGKALGDFISALRDRLITMYRAKQG